MHELTVVKSRICGEIVFVHPRVSSTKDGGRLENYAAPALRRFVADPLGLSAGDRATLAFFFALQDHRTPAARERTVALNDTIMRMLFASEFGAIAEFAAVYRELFDAPDASDEEIEVVRQDALRRLAEGSVGYVDPAAQALESGLGISGHQAFVLFDLEWRVLRRPGAFVTSDRGLAIYDRTPPHPWSGSAILSSEGAETTIPLTADACLMITPGDRKIEVEDISGDDADELNLRTFGWADGYIFGKQERCVRSVLELADARPADVVRPKTGSQVILFEADPDDTTIADRNEANGWPRYLFDDGLPHDYVVIEPGQNPTDVVSEVNAIVRERARKSLGLPAGADPPGRPVTEPINPWDIAR